MPVTSLLTVANPNTALKYAGAGSTAMYGSMGLRAVSSWSVAARGVSLNGRPYQLLARKREEWAVNDLYLNPGSTQFVGNSAKILSYTLMEEQ